MKNVARRKRIVFAAATVALSLMVTVTLLLVTDALLRSHYADTVGLNRWGYRGAIVRAKRADERRVVVLGGSTAFGYGVPPTESIPAQLEQRLRARRGAPVSVVNLGYVKEGAWAFRRTLADYAYLRYDVAVLYEGYNDLRRRNTRAFRHESPVFRLTGYLPFLPLVLAEKARAIRYGGDLAERFGREDPVFRPDLAERATANAFHAAAEATRSLERVLGPLSSADAAPETTPATIAACAEPFHHYCEGVRKGIDEALAHGARVLIVSQPYVSDTHVAQQRQVAALVRARFGDEPRVAYVDLGRAIDLRDPRLAFDGMHLTERGNAIIADRLVDPVSGFLDR